MRRQRFQLLTVAFLTLGAALLVPAHPAHADDAADAGTPAREKLDGTKLDSALADVRKARSDLKTLRASFTQQRRISLLATTVQSRGSLTFAVPDRLRWDLAPPDDIVYLVGPEGLTYKTKSSSATAPSSSAKIAAALSDLRALLTGDLAALRERYVLSGSRSHADLEITGSAKDKKSSVQGFTLVLDRSLVRPVRARLMEGKTDSIDLTFSNVILNEAVDPSLFRR